MFGSAYAYNADITYKHYTGRRTLALAARRHVTG
ncbi:hypothetical protein PI125_g24325 [Phytophthora idaei]|nr:hypothetical protein PI125_g24325 [Phytophthora idaei]KAG3126303.1 hypothetical protein PI126_g22386 [Phytophthora idaei]